MRSIIYTHLLNVSELSNCRLTEKSLTQATVSTSFQKAVTVSSSTSPEVHSLTNINSRNYSSTSECKINLVPSIP